MARQPGRDLKIQRGDGSTSPVYTTIAAVRTKSFTIGRNSIDVETDDDAGVQTLLEETYGKNVEATVSGITDNDDLIAAMMSNEPLPFEQIRLLRPNGSTLDGSFFFENYAETGEYQGAVTFEATFRSSGAVTFTAAP